MNKYEMILKMNELGGLRKAFYFIIDYKMNNCFLFDGLLPDDVKFSLKENKTNSPIAISNSRFFCFDSIEYKKYEQSFNIVKKNIAIGNSYLCNLTFRTPISTNFSLAEIYEYSQAPYKLKYKDEFVVFSPETFVVIKNQQIISYPMKGTIDAAIPNAEYLIMNDEKEKAEHATITDLIRNDLSMVAKNVVVNRYRYLDYIKTNSKNLIQVSSEISGELEVDYHHNIGCILFRLLPAGSICGAPKQKTLEIIEEAENDERGFYTGVFGHFDGENLESAVAIRYVEKNENRYFYRSGGGITSQSVCENEYQELLDKIYVPIH